MLKAMDGNKKIAVNTIIIYVRLIIVSFVNLVLSRVVLDALGASDFGLYNVVGSVVILLNVFNTSMASTTYRYLAFELGKGVEGNTNKVFNTSFFIHACFALLIFLICLPIGDWYISNYMFIPNGNYADAHFVFHISILAAAINTLLVPFQGLLVAYENFYANALIDILSNILKLGVVFLLIYLVDSRLRAYSLIILGYTLVSGISYVVYCRLKHKDVVSYRMPRDKKLFREMLSFSGWTLYGASANVGKAQGSAVIINFFFGTVLNASYAIAHQLETFVLMFARTINSAAVPQTTKSYSAGDIKRAISLTCHISKYTFLLMVLVSFPLIVEMDFILDIWLTDVPQYASTFCRLILLGNLMGCLGEGISNLINASGRIKGYQVVVHTVLISGLPISFLLYKMGTSVYTICIVYCVINFVNSFVKLYMLRRVVVFDVRDFFKISHLRMLYVSVPLVLFFLFFRPGSSLSGHLLGVVASAIVTLLMIISLGLDKGERTMVWRSLNKVIHKR